MESSKKLLKLSWAVSILLTVLTIVFSVAQLPTDALTELNRLSWGVTATATGFYYWKSKNENRAKYAQKFVQKFANEYGIDAALRIAEVVLKD